MPFLRHLFNINSHSFKLKTVVKLCSSMLAALKQLSASVLEATRLIFSTALQLSRIFFNQSFVEQLFKVKGFVHSINCVEHLAKRNEETSFTKKTVFKLTDFKSLRRRGLKAFKVKPSLFNSSFPRVEVYFRCCRLGSSALRVFNYVFLTI